MTYTYQRICAWCQGDLGEGTSSTPMPGPSHGLCKSCAGELRAEARQRRGATFDAPEETTPSCGQ